MKAWHWIPTDEKNMKNADKRADEEINAQCMK